MKTAGEVLKNAREKLGLSLEEVSSNTKIKRKFLELIEGSQYESLGSAVVVEGFIKNYAQFLGLDIERLLLLLKRDFPAEKGRLVVKEQAREGFRWTPKWTFATGIIVLILLFVGYLLWQYLHLVRTPYK